jgi:hypothetical protein
MAKARAAGTAWAIDFRVQEASSSRIWALAKLPSLECIDGYGFELESRYFFRPKVKLDQGPDHLLGEDPVGELLANRLQLKQQHLEVHALHD